MNSPRRSSWILLAGILLGFLGATWQGHLAAGYSKPDNFKRFHQRISPDTIYFPPYAMLETLALARWQPGKTLVIIGGNSILNGVGQPADELWSTRLQELLGDSYVVVNLAFRGAAPTQGAALVAESLLRRGLPVLYVANTNPAAAAGRAPGGASGYFYWQALEQDRLASFVARDQSIRLWLDALSPAEKQQQAEEHLGARLEPWFRHQSLWHHVGYRHFFTVWNFVLAGDSWQPRASFPDNEPHAQPPDLRFRQFLPEEMAIVRSFSASLAVPDAAGGWLLEAGNRQRLADDIEASFLPALRPRSLILLSQNAPYYRARLTPAEQARDACVYAACAQIWRDHGIACDIVGTDFAPEDFIDRAHLSGDGGQKVAQIVARRITEINHP
jgi:hypothetical protein